VGVSQATIDKIESGRTTLSRFLPRIAARLGIPQRDLDPFIGAHSLKPGPLEPDSIGPRDHADKWRESGLEEEGVAFGLKPLREESQHEMARFLNEALRRRSTSKPVAALPAAAADLPVYVANVDAFPIDWVRRPPPLANVVGAYGLLIKDAAMEPEFWPGDVALVHPHLPPSLQSACVFKTDTPPGGERSQLKHLASFDNAAWHVRQWNPPPGMKGELMLSRKEWPICHRVVGKYSRG
jgi:hypothetical protein